MGINAGAVGTVGVPGTAGKAGANAGTEGADVGALVGGTLGLIAGGEGGLHVLGLGPEHTSPPQQSEAITQAMPGVLQHAEDPMQSESAQSV